VAYDKHRVNPATVPPAQPPPGGDAAIDLRLSPAVEAVVKRMHGPCFVCSFAPRHQAVLIAHVIRHLNGDCPPREAREDVPSVD
jgi:hypothetical protein